MIAITQYILRNLRARFYAWLTRVVYSGPMVTFGKGWRCDSIPGLLIDKEASLKFGDRVELRSNKEICLSCIMAMKLLSGVPFILHVILELVKHKIRTT
mgnify:CR=1 FL=1